MPTPSTSPAFGDSDIPFLMADMGIPITVGGVPGIGLLDEADQIFVQDANRGEVVATATTLTIQTSAFPTCRIGDAVTVGGKTFSVRERLRESDGGLTKLLLGGSTAVDGGVAATGGRVVPVTANYVALAGDSVLVDSSAGNVTITLPLSAANGGGGITVKKVSLDAHLVTVLASGSDSVQDDTNVSFDAPNTSIDFLADGISEWEIE